MFAHLTRTPVYTYHGGTRRWHKYGTNSVQLSLDESAINSEGLYGTFTLRSGFFCDLTNS